MANLVFNIAKGMVNQYVSNVENNSPAGCELVLIAYVVVSDQDAAMIDVDTIAALEALSNVAEATNGSYARIDLVAADNVASAVDDSNDRRESDFDDQTFSSVASGDNWTDLVVAYDPTGSSADSALIPLTLSDFVVTPDGNDIVAQVNAAGFFRAA